MKKLFLILILLGPAVGGFGQTKRTTAAAAPDSAVAIESEETDEQSAFKRFDFDKLVIARNNLDRRAIEDLRANFLPAIKSSVIETGTYPARLTKLASPVFEFHKAVKSRAVVFTHSAPIVFTWKETFVTFSTAALDALSDDEITALVAHEIGHLYFAEELARARLEGDDRAERVIELECDLVALHTLSRMKVAESSLITAVEKLIARRRQLKIESFQPGSPPLASRQRLLKLYESREKLDNRAKPIK